MKSQKEISVKFEELNDQANDCLKLSPSDSVVSRVEFDFLSVALWALRWVSNDL